LDLKSFTDCPSTTGLLTGELPWLKWWLLRLRLLDLFSVLE
jgi:hypothetical protein